MTQPMGDSTSTPLARPRAWSRPLATICSPRSRISKSSAWICGRTSSTSRNELPYALVALINRRLLTEHREGQGMDFRKGIKHLQEGVHFLGL